MVSKVSYCKGYPIGQLRRFDGWREAKSPGGALGSTSSMVESEGSYATARDGIVFLHSDYVVTEGPFRTTETIFSEVTNDWKRFCSEHLRFEVPEL